MIQMKVIVAIDDSASAEKVVQNIVKRPWPADSEFKIVTVIEPIAQEEFGTGKWEKVASEALSKRKEHAFEVCAKVRRQLLEALPDAAVHVDLRRGSPREEILNAAVEWMSDHIILAAHNRIACERFVWGSVSRTVAAHAPCSVEIVRPRVHAKHDKSQQTAAIAN
jgi:nucleotide-binding universal stress UspA family protein